MSGRSTTKSVAYQVVNSRFGRILNMPRRALIASRYVAPKLSSMIEWIFCSREDTNFTYRLSDLNVLYLSHFLAAATGVDAGLALRYLREIEENRELAEAVSARVKESKYKYVSDSEFRIGKRAGWYALVRLIRPRLVVETGVDKGLGSCVLAAALKRNAEEGVIGKYIGTDINPEAGWLLSAADYKQAEIRVGDSISTLHQIEEPIDLFINDSDHSEDYEYREYKAIESKLSARAIIVGDNAHVTQMLERFARDTERSFLFFNEVPASHWYPGGGIGLAFNRRQSKEASEPLAPTSRIAIADPPGHGRT